MDNICNLWVEKERGSSPKDDFEQIVGRDVEVRVRESAKDVLKDVLQEEEMTEIPAKAGYRKLTPTRRGERNGHY